MCAPRLHRAHLEELGGRGEGDRILGIAEHAWVKPGPSRNVGGIDAELPEEHRRLRERPDTLPSLSHVLAKSPGGRVPPGQSEATRRHREATLILYGCRKIASSGKAAVFKFSLARMRQ